MKSLITLSLILPIFINCVHHDHDIGKNVSITDHGDTEGNIERNATLSERSEQDNTSLRGVINAFIGGKRICHCKCGRPNGEEKNNGILSFVQGMTDNISGNLGTGIPGGIGSGIGGGLSGLLGGIFGGTTISGGTKKSAPRPRLLAGDYLDSNAMPWLAVVLVQGVYRGAGVLLSDKHVLTSATALLNTSTTAVKVTLGLHERCGEDAASSNFSVSEILANPSFNPSSRAHDLALLKLATVVIFNTQIRPICLPYFCKARPKRCTVSNPSGQQMTVAGWADDPRPGAVSCLPRRVRLPLLSIDECNRSVTSTQFITPDKGCLGVIGSPGVICEGDAGSAVQYRGHKGNYELLGIITNVNVCGAPNSTLFVKIQDHMAWIKLNIKSDCTCSKH